MLWNLRRGDSREAAAAAGAHSKRILGRGLRVRGQGRSPFWRTPKEFCKGLGSVALQSTQSINNRYKREFRECRTHNKHWPLDYAKQRHALCLCVDDPGVCRGCCIEYRLSLSQVSVSLVSIPSLRIACRYPKSLSLVSLPPR